MRKITIESKHKRNFGDQKPTIIDWKGSNGEKAQMVRSHSIRSACHELANMSANQDLISINVIGKQSTGKSELCRTAAHLMHKFAKEENELNYDVTIIGRKEFMDLEETVKRLRPTNHIIVFDDLAFLKAGATTKQIDQIQYVLSVIRHLPNGEDVRIVIFKNFQYSKALPPFLRQNDATFISSVDDAEIKSMQELVGVGNTDKINLLKKMGVQLKLGTKDNAYFDYPLGSRKGKKKVTQKDYFRYHAKHPFLPYLYWNGASLRFVVSPLRTWIDKICPTCDDTEIAEKRTEDLTEFKKEFEEKYGGTKNIKRKILEIILIKHGLNVFNGSVNAGINFVEKYMETYGIKIEQIMETFDLQPKDKSKVRRIMPDMGKKPMGKLPIKEVDDT